MSQDKPIGARRVSVPPSSSSSIAVADIGTYFRVLRCIAAHPEWAMAASSADTTTTTTTTAALTEATAASSPSTDAPAATALTKGIRIPPSLVEPLESYRRWATTPSAREEDLALSRQQVKQEMTKLCRVNDNAAAMCDDVFADTGDEGAFVESDSRPFAQGSFMTAWGPMYAGPGRRICNRDEMQQIVPGLWCGSWRAASNLAVLQRYGITHVCCCIDTRPHFPDALVYHKIPAIDTPGYNMVPHFAQAFEFIDDAVVTSHGNVFVHCGAGISRAPTIVASYLMKKLRVSSAVAIQLVKQHRSVAAPNTGFREQLREYGRILRLEASLAKED